jgi:histidinol-phosphate aminotransferase
LNKAQRWINHSIQSMQAYHVSPAEGLIKLDAMENPFSWPEELVQEWSDKIKSVSINRYPDPGATTLRNKLRSVMQVPDNLSIMFGNGSDELIQLIALALAQPDRIYLSFEPSFIMYRQITLAVNTHYKSVQLNSIDFSLNRSGILEAIKQYQPALIFIAYPNNPTGNLFDKELLLEVARTATGLVVIDEAYHAFSGESFLDYVDQYDNLLVLRTFSKSGLAGLRLGYLIGRRDWLDELEKIRLPYNINSLSQITVEFILDHYDLLETQAQQICENRNYLFNGLSDITGIKVWPSDANFILIRVVNGHADELYENLKQQGILIKTLHGTHPLMENCLRVTIGTKEENMFFLEILRKLFKSPIP